MIEGQNPIEVWTEKYLDRDYIDSNLGTSSEVQKEIFEDSLYHKVGEEYAERLIRLIDNRGVNQALRTAKAYDQNLDFKELGSPPLYELDTERIKKEGIPDESHERAIENFRERI